MKLKKIVAYITRSWKDEPNLPHSRLRILPPFLIELLSYLIVLLIIYQLVAYIWSLTL